MSRFKDVLRNPAVRIIFGMCAIVAVVLILFYSSLENAIDNINNERTERANQACTISEDVQRDEVRGLSLTYEYLMGLTDRQLQNPINSLIVRELPVQEKEAEEDDAPDYCDVEDLGLPEPDSKIEPRPAELQGEGFPPVPKGHRAE